MRPPCSRSPKYVVLQQVQAQEHEAIGLGLASLLVSLGLAWLLARLIAGPVIALTADADAFAAGDLSHRSQVEAEGELGQLAETFNRMAAALERRSNELTDSERRYRALFDTLPLPMWIYNVQWRTTVCPRWIMRCWTSPLLPPRSPRQSPPCLAPQRPASDD